MTLRTEVIRKQNEARELLRDIDSRWLTCQKLTRSNSFAEQLGKLIQCADLTNLERIAGTFYDEVIAAHAAQLKEMKEEK
jgi:hypothetical protein